MDIYKVPRLLNTTSSDHCTLLKYKMKPTHNTIPRNETLKYVHTNIGPHIYIYVCICSAMI